MDILVLILSFLFVALGFFILALTFVSILWSEVLQGYFMKNNKAIFDGPHESDNEFYYLDEHRFYKIMHMISENAYDSSKNWTAKELIISNMIFWKVASIQQTKPGVTKEQFDELFSWKERRFLYYCSADLPHALSEVELHELYQQARNYEPAMTPLRVMAITDVSAWKDWHNRLQQAEHEVYN